MSIIAKTVFGVYLLIFMYLGVIELSDEIKESFNDLIAHTIGYVMLVVVGVFAFPKKKWFIRIAIFCFAYSVLIECIQYFIPHRTLSVYDLVANAVGVVVGLIVAGVIWPLIQRIQQLPDEAEV